MSTVPASDIRTGTRRLGRMAGEKKEAMGSQIAGGNLARTPRTQAAEDEGPGTSTPAHCRRLRRSRGVREH